MEIRHLKHFVALAEEGKFTAAANRMHIVQSGLSVSNKELFLEYARGCLTTLKDGVLAVQSQSGVVRGRLHLAILQSLTPYVPLARLLGRFRSAYPEVEFAV